MENLHQSPKSEHHLYDDFLALKKQEILNQFKNQELNNGQVWQEKQEDHMFN